MKNKRFIWDLLSLLLLATICVCMASCDNSSNNDDDDDVGETSIVGTWVDGTTTISFGSNGSYNLTDTSVPEFPQYRKGTYVYNSIKGLLTINVVAVAGQNGAYKETYLVQTLTATTLVLMYLDGDVEGYYTRK